MYSVPPQLQSAHGLGNHYVAHRPIQYPQLPTSLPPPPALSRGHYTRPEGFLDLNTDLNNNNTTSSEQSAPSHPPASQSRYSVSDQSPTDLLGQRFDSLAVINSFDKISYGNPHDNQPQSQSTHHSPQS